MTESYCALCGTLLAEGNFAWYDNDLCLKCETDILIQDDLDYYSLDDEDEL